MWLEVGSLEVKLGQVNIPRDTPCVRGELLAAVLELPARAGRLNLGKVQSKGNLHIHPSYLFCYQLSSYVIKRFINGKAGIKQAS